MSAGEGGFSGAPPSGSRFPTIGTLLALSPALVAATTGTRGLALASVVLPIVVASRLLESALGPGRRSGTRLALQLLLVGVMVTAADLVFQAVSPALRRDLGLYLQLTGASCILLRGSASAEGAERSAGATLLDALGVGFGAAVALVLVACIREALGAGTVTLGVGKLGFSLVLGFIHTAPAAVAVEAGGGLLIVGLLMGLARWVGMRRRRT